ncbi:hypothetical protein NDU88_003511 [Pleurodeles waltl]|uniref:Uncharacterized protein n=1 Tax=Pleurodeles waltl TaxID=8319 RepID=A0AAV7QFL0_PLEWA|nr:hypothetical protein NDU88_003511 [Pleurodeles waltl]
MAHEVKGPLLRTLGQQLGGRIGSPLPNLGKLLNNGYGTVRSTRDRRRRLLTLDPYWLAQAGAGCDVQQLSDLSSWARWYWGIERAYCRGSSHTGEVGAPLVTPASGALASYLDSRTSPT